MDSARTSTGTVTIKDTSDGLFEFQLNFNLLDERIRKTESALIGLQKDIDHLCKDAATKEDMAKLQTEIFKSSKEIADALRESQTSVLRWACGLGIGAFLTLSIGLAGLLFTIAK